MALTTSIVLCTYNGARFLPVQWASLLAQSRLPDEIVVRDDASTDATPILLEALVADARARGIAVTFLRGGQNVGYIENFTAAIRAASGDIVFLCDQDDAWHPGKLATQLHAFERRPALQLLCSDACRIDDAGGRMPRSLFDMLTFKSAERRAVHAGRGFEVLMRRNVATGATVALRRTLADRALPVPARWVHDEWLAIVAAALGGFDCFEPPLVDYRQHDGNQIGMHDRGFAQLWRELRYPRADLIQDLIVRNEALLQRLEAMQPAVPTACVESVRAKLAHLRRRATAVGPPWSRLGPVLAEMFNGGYRRFSTGWRSALRDLVRRT